MFYNLFEEPIKKAKKFRGLILTSDFDPIFGGVGAVVREFFDALSFSSEIEATVMYPFFSSSRYWCFRSFREACLIDLLSQPEQETIDHINRNYDFVHVHTPSPKYAAYCLHLRIPIVYTCHAVVKHTLSYMKGISREHTKAVKEIMRSQEIILSKAKKIIVFTSTGEKILKGNYPYTKPVVIPNGINPERILSYDEKIPHMKGIFPRRKGINILFLGRITYAKGIENLIEIAKKLKGKENFLIIVVGNLEWNTRKYEQEFKKTIPERLYKNFLFTGQVDKKWRANFLQLSDVLIHPSVHDSFPNVILEAMAAKVPIVANKVDGIKDMLEHGKTALLVKPGDNCKMADAILRISKNTNLRRKLVEEAYRKVVKEYDWNGIVSQHINLYKELIATKT